MTCPFVSSYRGMLLVAIDGSTANVPTNPETVARWGNSSGFGREQATMGLSAAFDVVNRQLLDLTINRGGFDERAEVARHLAAIAPVVGDVPIALVLDRGYPSFLLMAALADMGVPYLMRCQRSFMSAEFRECEAAGGDVELDLALTRARLKDARRSHPDDWACLTGRGPLRVRCVLADAGGDAPERLVTTIGADVMAAGELAEVYHMRWGVETCFEFMKDRLQMENFTGTRPRLIEQDVYATAYLVNVAFDLANEAEREAADDIAARNYKHAMAANRTVAIGVLKDELIRLVTAPDDGAREAMMAGIVAELGRCLVPVRPARAYGRDGLDRNHHANRYSNTHKRAF
ncbi:MAG: transposase, partial [Atopobiaceae bacterium]|nr:transposase [Atopobiaceae bacterium]